MKMGASLGSLFPKTVRMMVSSGLAGAYVQPCPRIKISDLEGDMKNFTPLRLGVFGATWFLGGLAYFASYVHPESPGIIIDYGVPILPRLIVLLGALMMICSAAWAITLWFRSKRARS